MMLNAEGRNLVTLANECKHKQGDRALHDQSVPPHVEVSKKTAQNVLVQNYSLQYHVPSTCCQGSTEGNVGPHHRH